MSDETSYPAALPFLFFSLGLLVSPELTRPRAAVSLLLLATALTLCLSARRRFRVALLVVMFALAIWIRDERLRVEQSDRNLVDRFGTSRFVEIEAPFGEGWIPLDDDGFVLRADHFIVPREQHRVEAPLTIYLYSTPPPEESPLSVRASGFIRPDEHGGYRLQVKSARLVAYRGGTRNRWNPREWNRSLKMRLDATAKKNPAARQGAALAEALALGRKERLSLAVRSSYQRAGTYHLLVFSGMQIALVAAFLSGVLAFFRRPRVTDAVLLTLAILAPLFTARDPSVERCAWMIGLYAISRIAHRPTSMGNLLFVSALIRLAGRPEELGDAGFVLTYAATGGLLFIGRPMTRLFRNPLARAVAFGLGAELATIPWTLYFFHQAVFGSSLLTLVLAPLFTLMLACSAAALAMPGANEGLIILLLRAIEGLNATCCHINGLVDLLRLSVVAASPPLPLLIAVYVAVVMLLALRAADPKPLLMGLLLLMVPAVVFVVALKRSSVPTPQVEILDVGQGDAILIRDGRRAMLIDAGPPSKGMALRGHTLVPLLLDRGVRHLSAVAVTHPHPDHCGGVPGVISDLKVDEVWIAGRHVGSPCGASILEAIEKRGSSLVLAGKAATCRFGSFTVESLVTRGRFRRSVENNSSVLYRVQTGGRRALLTGDIEKERERDLVADNDRNDWLRADILKVAHHGSASSTTTPFLESVRPRIAVVSCGRRNRFGHPDAHVMQLLGSRRVRTYRTDRSGTILIRFWRNHVFVTAEIDSPRPGT